MAKVSICIPAYNNAQAVKRLIESVEKQTFTDYEIILTDDSEGDEVRKLVEKKRNVMYFRNEKRLGAAANWNAAISAGSGEYVKIMHHDDWFTDAESLQGFVDLLEQHSEADLAFSGSRQEGMGGSYARCISPEDAELIRKDYRNLFLGNTIGAPSAVIVRRSAMEGGTGLLEGEGSSEEEGCPEGRKIGAGRYDGKLTWLVDMEYYMGILRNNPCFAYTEKPLVSIGTSAGQLTESCRDDKDLNAFEYGYIYDKYGLGSEKKYRRKLVQILADGGKSAEEAGIHGIGRAEYGAEKVRKLLSKIEWKLTHLIGGKMALLLLFILFAASLLPVLGLSGINCATGDDIGYGILTHQAWLSEHSLGAVCRAAADTVKHYYYGWQGTWLSVFLFTLQPEVFSPGAYVIVPALMLGLWLLSTWLLSRYVLVRIAGFPKESFGILFLLFAAAAIQFVPSTKSAIFWYNGTAHYIIPYAIALLAVYFYLKFVCGRDGKRTGSCGAYVGLSICMALLGGGNYQAALLAPMLMVLLPLFWWKDGRRRVRTMACVFPLLLEMAGLIVSMKAPGNKARGGEAFGFTVSAAVKTVLACFVRGAVQAGQYIAEHPLLLLFFAAAGVVFWYCVPDGNAPGGSKGLNGAGNSAPALFVFFSYGIYCAMFAPEIYAGVEVSGGVYNMNFYIFLFMVFGDMIYILGGLAGRRKGRAGFPLLPVAMVLAAGFLIIFRWDVKGMTTYRCIDYVRSGQAADFRGQMEYQHSVLLDENAVDVVLPAVNDDQGPLMHMPVTDDPEAWTNTITKRFYGKNSVVAVPAEVWQDLQGKNETWKQID